MIQCTWDGYLGVAILHTCAAEIVFRFICVSIVAADVQNRCNGRRYAMYIDVMSSKVLETLGRV